MKKLIILLLVTVSTILFCSCSSNEASDTYFIHAMGFKKENDEYTLFSVCEKFEKDNSEYFLINHRGKDIEGTLDKMRKEYKDCYFATIKYYFISSETDKSLISAMAKEICDSNHLPSKNIICMISGNSIEDFMGQIKNSDDTKKIQKALDGKSINTVNFFSHYTSGKNLKTTVLSQQEDGTLTAKETTISPR